MIRSTFYGFGTALSGMSASQMALNVTGHNIANMDTVGFTRQRLDLNSIAAPSYADRYAARKPSAIGQGVMVERVSQMRDPFLDNRFRREASSIGELDAYLSSIGEIARVFDEIRYDALQGALRDFKTQLQMYTQTPSDIAIESTVRAKAEAVLNLFNQYSRELATVRADQEKILEEISIPRVNAILEDIALLNRNIRQSELFGDPALELKDRRNMLLDELSSYIRIDVTYEKDKEFPHIDNMRVAFLGTALDAEGNETSPRDGIPLGLQSRTLVFGREHAVLGVMQHQNTGETQLYIDTYYQDKSLHQILYQVDHPIHPLDSSKNPPALQFTTGALKGVLDMLNRSGEFDVPASNIRGIGFYEQILDQIVSDFALEFNKANAKPIYGSVQLFEHDPDNPDPFIAAWIADGFLKPAVDAANNPLVDGDGNQLYYMDIRPAYDAAGRVIRDANGNQLVYRPTGNDALDALLAAASPAHRPMVDGSGRTLYAFPPGLEAAIASPVRKDAMGRDLFLEPDPALGDFFEPVPGETDDGGNQLYRLLITPAVDDNGNAIRDMNGNRVFATTDTAIIGASTPAREIITDRQGIPLFELPDELLDSAATDGTDPLFDIPYLYQPLFTIDNPPIATELWKTQVFHATGDDAFDALLVPVLDMHGEPVSDAGGPLYFMPMTAALGQDGQPLFGTDFDSPHNAPLYHSTGDPALDALLGLTAAEDANGDRIKDHNGNELWWGPAVAPVVDAGVPVLYSQYTFKPDSEAGNITLAQAWRQNEYGITYTMVDAPLGGTPDTSGGTDNLLYMIALLDKQFNFTTGGIRPPGGEVPPGSTNLFSGSFLEMFNNIGSIAQLDANSKSSAAAAHMIVITGIEDLRNSISSVSMDEEGVNLLRFQKAYTANARFMTTLDEALDHLINRTGVVGR